jgi:hypothetical protein
MAVSGDSVTLTRQQLKEFANAIQSQTIEKIKNEIEGMSIYVEEEVSIELSGLELEVTVDNDAILNNISREINDSDKITNEDVQTYLDELEE